MAKGYWETEVPQVVQLGKNEFRYFKNAGKLQVYTLRPGTAYGVSSGVTIDLVAMADGEKQQLLQLFGSAAGQQVPA